MRKTVKKPIPVEVVPPVEISPSPQVHTETTPEVEIAAPAPIDEVMITAKRKWMFGLGMFVIFILVLGGIGFGYMENMAPPKKAQTISPTPRKMISPTPTVKLRISVWNGSGVAGRAGKVKDELIEAGYQVDEAANAPSIQNGTTLLLAPKVAYKEVELKSALSKNDIEIQKVEVLTSDEYDVRIILGR